MVEEIFLPIVLSLCLGVLHAHIVAPYSVKQRRKKTLGTPGSKTKSTLKSETNAGLSSRKASLKSSQMGDGILQQGHVNCTYLTEVNSDNIPSRPENFSSNRSKKRGILFAKTSSHRSNSVQNEDDFHSSDVKKISNLEEDYSETEAKDSSSSEQEIDSTNKMTLQEEVSEINDLNCVEQLCSTKKHVKINDDCERKSKSNSRQMSQSFPAVEDIPNEDLKKFITAKYKKIPDPTPMNNVKKDKDKSHWKQGSVVNSKGFKTTKIRRANSEWVGVNSGPSSDNAKNHLTPVSNITTISPVDQNNTDAFNVNKLPDHNDNVTNQDHISDESTFVIPPIPSNKEIENLCATCDLICKAKITMTDSKCTQSVSQPHTPLNHYNSKLKHRIDVRKVSSADASPTPSRKNSTCFSTPVDLNREHLNSNHLDNEINLAVNHSLSNSSQDQLSNHSLNDNTIKQNVDMSISSEDVSSKMVDLNEDTITKSHKKREEFKQLFEIKAQSIPKQDQGTANSSSSSSRKKFSDVMKHNKIKRRYREDHKMTSVDNYHSKNIKEVLQSMSETEYDRMNSDVNSTGNSTSDGDDICANGVIKPDSEQPKNSDIKQEFPHNIFKDTTNIQNGMNENNPTSEEYINPQNSGTDGKVETLNDDPFLLWYKEIHTPGPLNGVNESVSCYIWEDDELKKTNLSLLDIGWSIIQAVEQHEHDKSNSRFGFLTMIFLCFTPIYFRIYANWNYLSKVMEMSRHTYIIDFLLPHNNSLVKFLISSENTSIAVQDAEFNLSHYRTYNWSDDIIPLTLTSIIGSEWPIRLIVLIGVISRIILYSMTFIMLCVAENSFEQRLQYAKHFCRLTSSRRARKYYLPHFRLNKLANIKCWLSLRSYLKKRGPQRSVESIISSAFYMLLAMLSLVCVNLLQNGNNSFINKLINWDLTLCSVALGIFMMRFLVLGTKITKKYRNLSVIITEQINLFLAMQTRPHKKEELTLAHNVLRLAESLLKEVEGPFRICGWSMNPFLYNILKVVILSVFSTVLSETCGFKMKLYKIKINPANW